ncbi:unnamed protein product, partial [Prunus brigantina]
MIHYASQLMTAPVMAPKPSELAGVDSSSAHSVKALLTCLTVRQIKIIEPTDPILGNCSNRSTTQPRTGSHLSPTQKSHQGPVAEASAGSQKLLNPPLPNDKGCAEAMGTRKMAPSKNQSASAKPASWSLYRSCAYELSRNFSTPFQNVPKQGACEICSNHVRLTKSHVPKEKGQPSLTRASPWLHAGINGRLDLSFKPRRAEA